MTFFDRNKKPDTPTPKAADQQTAIGEMSGFRGIEDVKRNAPASTAEPTATPAPGVDKSRELGAKRVAAVQGKARTKKEQEAQDAAKQAEAQQKALETVGKTITNKLAALPYEVWSALAADPNLKLRTEEQKELADQYFLLVQSINPDFTKPVWLLGSIFLLNSVMISERIKYMNDKLALEDRTVGEIQDRKPQ